METSQGMPGYTFGGIVIICCYDCISALCSKVGERTFTTTRQDGDKSKTTLVMGTTTVPPNYYFHGCKGIMNSSSDKVKNNSPRLGIRAQVPTVLLVRQAVRIMQGLTTERLPRLTPRYPKTPTL